ncbi:MAG: adenylate/guanylate cyclase domain-containing protein [Hyphomonadaceae bacterium]
MAEVSTSDPGVERRLAVIVAIDAVGYSHQSEINEAATIAAIKALRERVTRNAAAHGGRVFSSAGDGFMLEFSSATGAIAFVDVLFADQRVPLRAGAHLGEVSDADAGDLLGHGVNVAARLLALAQPNELILSSQLKEALGPDLVRRLERRGHVTLDKMDARLELWVLSVAWQAPPWQAKLSALGRQPRLLWLAAAAIGAVALSAAAFSGWLRPPSPQAEASIAVLPFASLDTGEDGQSYADSMSASLATTLGRTGMSVVSWRSSALQRGETSADAARALNARYVVEGEVRRDGDAVHVTVRVQNGRDNLTVISESFDSRTSEASALPDRIAVRIGQQQELLRATLRGGADARVAAEVNRVNDLMQRDQYRAAYERSRAAARAYPNSPAALFNLARVAGFYYYFFSTQEFPATLAEARAANARAHRIAPQAPDYYVGEAYLIPRHDYVERENLLMQAMRVDSEASILADESKLALYAAQFYMATGRIAEGAALIERAREGDPFDSYTVGIQITALLASDDRAGVRRAIAQADRFWPNDFEITEARLAHGALAGASSDVAALMRDPAIAERFEPPDAAQPIRSMLRALASRRAIDIDTAVRECQRHRRGAPGNGACIRGLVLLGRMDDAFAWVDSKLPNQHGLTATDEERVRSGDFPLVPIWFFEPEMAPFRADPRFIAVAERADLLRYWRETGNGPDFCRTERIPVCEALH